MAGSELEGMKMEQSRERFANEVDVALAQSARPFAIHNARKVDARGLPVMLTFMRTVRGAVPSMMACRAYVWLARVT